MGTRRRAATLTGKPKKALAIAQYPGRFCPGFSGKRVHDRVRERGKPANIAAARKTRVFVCSGTAIGRADCASVFVTARDNDPSLDTLVIGRR